MKTALCKSCKAEIVWCVTIAGKRCPYDAVPVPNGNSVLEEQADGSVVARVLPPVQLEGRERHVSHFNRCRDSASWRKK